MKAIKDKNFSSFGDRFMTTRNANQKYVASGLNLQLGIFFNNKNPEIF